MQSPVVLRTESLDELRDGRDVGIVDRGSEGSSRLLGEVERQLLGSRGRLGGWCPEELLGLARRRLTRERVGVEVLEDRRQLAEALDEGFVALRLGVNVVVVVIIVVVVDRALRLPAGNGHPLVEGLHRSIQTRFVLRRCARQRRGGANHCRHEQSRSCDPSTCS